MAASHPSAVRNSQATYFQQSWIAGLALVTITVCAYTLRNLAEGFEQALSGLSLFSLIHILSGGRFPAGSPMMMLTALLAGTTLVSPASAASPAAAPPSQTIVYTSNMPPNWDPYLFEGDGTSRRLTNHPALDYNPVRLTHNKWEDGLAFWVSESLDEMLTPGRTSEVVATAPSEGPSRAESNAGL